MEETQSDSKLEESIVSSRNSQSAAFTISFDEDQANGENKKRPCSTNPFVKRHIRNKSLPIGPTETNGRKVHYEESKSYSFINNGVKGGNSNSPNSSDGGTYTLDTDNSELQEARYSIDKVFGVEHHQLGQKTSGQWLDQWLQDSVKNTSHTDVVNNNNNNRHRLRTTSSTSLRQSKIPSPIYYNYQRISNSLVTVKGMQAALYKAKSKRSVDSKDTEEESNDRDILSGKEKKKMVASIVIDSDDDKNMCEKQRGQYNTRLNRAFSLRRDRLNNKSCASSIPSKLNTVTVLNNNVNHQRYSSSSSLNLSNSVTKSVISSTPISVIPKERKKKPVDVFKDKASNNNNCKTKSSHQAELLNWKRRKNYDPIKAAAEGRRKSMEKHRKAENIPSAESGPTSTSVRRITRSASFQETVNHGYETDTLSSTDDTEITVSIEEDDYKIPKAPSTSLRNSPEGSVRSLVASYCSSLGNGGNSNVSTSQDQEESVDTRLFELSQQIRLSSYHLLHTLRTNNDNEGKRNEEESSNGMLSPSNTSTLDNLIDVSLIIQDLHELLLG